MNSGLNYNNAKLVFGKCIDVMEWSMTSYYLGLNYK